MHEFEALLFSDCTGFCRGIYRADLQAEFQAIRDQFETPEHIDDSPEDAPSKRIIRVFPGYDKVLLGSLASMEIGLDAMRNDCPHFNEWVSRLESLAG